MASGFSSESDALPFASRREWETWLRKNHNKVDGVWMKFAKKSSGIPTVTYDEALEVALCYGWIDAKIKRLDDKYHLQWWTPRRARSKWSQRNAERVKQLIAEGKMKPAGLKEIERAKADGRWDAAYASPGRAQVPEDFLKALKKNAKARRFFETLSKSNTYAIYFQITDAKKPETRARRIAKFVEMLEKGEKLY